MSSPLPEVDLNVCRTTADQCCQYYARILGTYEQTQKDPQWQAEKSIAEEWRLLLDVEEPADSQFVNLESRVHPMWAAQQCGSTWIWMATCIDVWLRSRGRAGFGYNPWFKDRPPTTVLPLE